MKRVDPVPCQHIADYYDHKQAQHPCIGNNLLWRGYAQFSAGLIESYEMNNLFRPIIKVQNERHLEN